MKIALIVGSLSQGSLNKKLAQALAEAMPDEVTITFPSIRMPLFDYETEGDFPAEATAFKREIEAADGLVFVTPEYNRSFPGVLKNAIDWASRPHGENSFTGKPAAIIGASVSPLGTTQSQQQLRNVALYLGTKLMGQPEVYSFFSRDFEEDGTPTAHMAEKLEEFANAFLAHVRD